MEPVDALLGYMQTWCDMAVADGQAATQFLRQAGSGQIN
jgi:hypothetical protein